MVDALIIGGGIAGLQAAIQLGRYQRHVVVIDAGKGRSSVCRSYHNLLGWPNGVSGPELRAMGRAQAARLNVEFQTDTITRLERTGETFVARGNTGASWEARTVLLATGIVENIPDIPGIEPTLGLSMYVCPDCDGYEIRGKSTVVMGSGDTGADMALTLLYWSDQLTYINVGMRPVTPARMTKLGEAGVRYIEAEVTRVVSTDDGMVKRLVLRNNESMPFERGFVAFGGNRVESDLAAQVGAKCLHNRHVAIHPRTKMTSVPGLWAAGDVAAHSEQVSIAMGDGSQAAIFMQKALLGESVDPFQS